MTGKVCQINQPGILFIFTRVITEKTFYFAMKLVFLVYGGVRILCDEPFFVSDMSTKSSDHNLRQLKIFIIKIASLLYFSYT